MSDRQVKIIIKNSVVPSKIPSLSSLTLGEIAYNSNDSKLYGIQTSGGTPIGVREIGFDKQPLNSNLTNLSSLSGIGYVVRMSDGSFLNRQISGTTNQIIVTNPSGVSGNSLISLSNIITSGSVGGVNSIPVISYDATGRIVSATTATINQLTQPVKTYFTESATTNVTTVPTAFFTVQPLNSLAIPNGKYQCHYYSEVVSNTPDALLNVSVNSINNSLSGEVVSMNIEPNATSALLNSANHTLPFTFFFEVFLTSFPNNGINFSCSMSNGTGTINNKKLMIQRIG